MKISKIYVIYINHSQKIVIYGGKEFSKRINKITIGFVFDCMFNELKSNLRLLSDQGYSINKRAY